jgi:site-specific DNA recombinase
MRWNTPDQWIWSPEPTHEPLVDRNDWQRVQHMTTTQQRAPRSTDVTYLLRGRVLCAACGRRMTGQTQTHRRKYYRCELRRARPGLTIEDHPNDLYVREAALVDALDTWLDELFAPEHASETARLIAAADAPSDQDDAIADARRRLHEARQRLTRYRRALDDGADPTTVTAWITEAAEQERAARADLQRSTASAPVPLDADDVLATIERFGSLTSMLEHAEPKDRAQLYNTLGVTATYDAIARTAVLEVALPRSANNVSEGRHKPQVHAIPAGAWLIAA